jgi:intracellular sulfur oxidation DsrE/DsrF family protein
VSQSNRNDEVSEVNRLDRRTLMKGAAGGAIASGLIAAAPALTGAALPAAVPNNFRAAVHVTDENALQYAYSALETISQNYSKAKGRLIIDGAAVKILTTDDGLNNIKAVHDGGADVWVANDALAINGIDPASLPDFINTDNPGVIAVLESQSTGYMYYKP